jgi:CheY-like chemotaxis protein
MSSETLRELGYTVVEASSGKEAIKKIKEGTVPHLLFTDAVMPEMTGAELAAELAKTLPNLEVLFTTGYTRNCGSAWRGFGIGIVAVFGKLHHLEFSTGRT